MPRARDGQAVRLRPATMDDSDTLLELQRKPETRRFVQPPKFGRSIAVEAFRNGAIDLHSSHLHRQSVRSRLERHALAVDLEAQFTPPHSQSNGIPMLFERDQLDADLRSVAQFHYRFFTEI